MQVEANHWINKCAFTFLLANVATVRNVKTAENMSRITKSSWQIKMMFKLKFNKNLLKLKHFFNNDRPRTDGSSGPL